MARIFKPILQSQGQGAKVMRIVGSSNLKKFDPFLMLDYFKSRLPGGFPDHPHRGFTTVGYGISGTFCHQDFNGKKYYQREGLAWMNAGRGIIHSEMPGSFEEDSEGFQLWINLEKKNKMIPSSYDIAKVEDIKVHEKDGARVKVLAGKWQDKQGIVKPLSPVYHLDVQILEKGKFEIKIPGHWNSLIFVFRGSVNYKGKHKVDTLNCCVLDNSKQQGQLTHFFDSEAGGRFILISGQPLNQPVAQYGPFVMNTQQQLYEAFEDYQNCRNGFENRKNWKSQNQYLRDGKKIQELWKDYKP